MSHLEFSEESSPRHRPDTTLRVRCWRNRPADRAATPSATTLRVGTICEKVRHMQLMSVSLLSSSPRSSPLYSLGSRRIQVRMLTTKSLSQAQGSVDAPTRYSLVWWTTLSMSSVTRPPAQTLLVLRFFSFANRHRDAKSASPRPNRSAECNMTSVNRAGHLLSLTPAHTRTPSTLLVPTRCIWHNRNFPSVCVDMHAMER